MLKKRKSSTATNKKAVARKPNTDYSALTDQIKPVSSLGLILAALFYGRAGTGKTTLSSTFPKPILHMDIREKGTDSVSDVEDLYTISVDNWDTFEQIYWYLASGESGYNTVVIDAVSQLQDFAMEKVLAENGSGDGTMSQRLWGKISGLMKEWIINYRDLVDQGINVVFLAHDRAKDRDEGEDGEIDPSVGPRVMPSVSSILTASVKVIGNTFIREQNIKQESGKRVRKIDYCLRLGPHAYYETKIRQPKGSKVPDILANPDYDQLVEIMKGEYVAPAKAGSISGKTLIRRKTK